MLEDKLPKIDTGQIKDEHGDGRDREREWNYKNNNHHITHTTNVSFFLIYYSYFTSFTFTAFYASLMQYVLIRLCYSNNNNVKEYFHCLTDLFPISYNLT